MDSDWTRFLELADRLNDAPPELVELALRYGNREDREVLKELEGEMARRSAIKNPTPVLNHSPKANLLNLRQCEDFLANLRRQEEDLGRKQVELAQDLLRIQAARRIFEKILKTVLRAECRHFASDRGAMPHATEEEVVAGLQELKEEGGLELHEFIGELEQVLNDRE